VRGGPAWLAPLWGVVALSFALLLVGVGFGGTLVGGLAMVLSWFLVLTAALGLADAHRRAGEDALAEQAMRVRVLEGALTEARARLEAAETRLGALEGVEVEPVDAAESAEAAEGDPEPGSAPWWRGAWRRIQG
jgi:hypothetical protein